MQKIQKFQPSKIYSAPKSKTTYELLDRAALQYTPEADEYFYRFAVPFIREQMQRR
jgi:hypothetical protein